MYKPKYKIITLPTGEHVKVDTKFYPMLKTLGSWCRQTRRYAAKRHLSKLILMHNVVYKWEYGKIPKGYTVDHKNGSGFDNRLQNLRLATQTQQNFNTGPRSSNTSGYRGVFWHIGAKKWMVQLRKNNEYYYGGVFKKKKDAIRVAAELYQELAGEFAR